MFVPSKKGGVGCGTRKAEKDLSADERDSAVFSCCGDPFPGARQKAATKLHAISCADLTRGLTAEAAADFRARLGAQLGMTESMHIYVTAEFMLAAAAKAKCDVTTGCAAEISAEVRATVRQGLQGSATVGGVPVVGEVYMQFTVGAHATGKASIGPDGVEAGVSAGVDASVTYGASVSGEVGQGVTVGADGYYQTGGSAKASAGGTMSLEEVSAGVKLDAELGTRIGFGTNIDHEHGGVELGTSVCSGCAGVSVRPSVQFNGCAVTVGAQVSAAVAVGASASGSGTVNFCSLGGALADLGEDLGVYAYHGLQDVANGLVGGTERGLAVAAVELANVAGDIADESERVAGDIANGAVTAVNDIGQGFSDAAAAVDDAAGQALGAIGGAAEDVGGAIEDVGGAIEDAAKIFCFGIFC